MTLVRDDWVSIDGVLSGPPERIYKMISDDNERRTGKSGNNMRQMRAAFGISTADETIHEWLRFWDSITSEQRIQLRRMNLSIIPDDFPRPLGHKLPQSNIPSPSTIGETT
jgi:hypothetical protein